MPASDFHIQVRRSVMAELKADAGYTSIVPAANIHPQTTPTTPVWPFGRYGAPSGLPLRAACLRGATANIVWHTFAKPRMQGAQVVETAEDHAGRAGSAVIAALDGKSLAIPGGTAKLSWTGSQLLRDGDEADAYHHIAEFAVRVFA